MVAGTARLYAIIGDPVGHVRTPLVFNAYFAEHGIDAVCVPIHIARTNSKPPWRA